MLFGKDGRRWAHTQHGIQLAIVQALHDTGSRETTCRAVNGGSRHGLAMLQRARMVELYMASVRGAYRHVPSLRLHWDGSHHGGLDVQIGCALAHKGRTMEVFAAYLQPVVPSEHL